MAHLEVAKSALNDNLPQKCNFNLYEFFHDPSKKIWVAAALTILLYLAQSS